MILALIRIVRGMQFYGEVLLLFQFFPLGSMKEGIDCHGRSFMIEHLS